MEKKKKESGHEQWEVEGWASDVLRAEEIKNDPEKMKCVMEHLEKKKKAISSIQEIKDAASEMDKEEDEG